MGLFSAKGEPFTFTQPSDDIDVSQRVLEILPDPGAIVVEMCWSVAGDSGAEVASREIERYRRPNGVFVPSDTIHLPFKESGGLVHLLVILQAGVQVVCSVWASRGLRRADEKQFGPVVEEVCVDQGVPPAAIWALSQRGADELSLAGLAQSLNSHYSDKPDFKLRIAERSLCKWRS